MIAVCFYSLRTNKNILNRGNAILRCLIFGVSFHHRLRADMRGRVKVNRKPQEATEEGGRMVGSGVKAEPLKTAENQTGGVMVKQNTRTVSPINDTRRHPDPNLAASIATMSFAGFTMDRVCNALRLSESTVRQYYDFEFKNGQTNLVSEIAGSLAQRALNGSDTAAIFLLKTRGGGKFTERNAVELTGANGGPIEIQQRTEILAGVAGLLERGILIEGEVEKKGAEAPE